MAEQPPEWTDPAMRLGYGARGVVYIIVGVFAVMAAWQGGQTEGTKGALARVQDEWWGVLLLAIVAVGLLCYAAWRVVNAWMDLDDKGTDAKGIIGRIAMVVTAIVYLSLAIYVVSLLFGGGQSGSGGGQGGGSGGGTESLTATLMAQPFGRWLVGFVGLCIIGAGLNYGYKAIAEKYKEHMRKTPTSESLQFVVKFGLIAHGITLAIVGGFFVWAAWTYDPSKAGGLEQALEAIRSAAFGQILFAVIALGLLAFAAYCFVEAVYRVIPRLKPSDMATLADQGEQALRQAGNAAKRAAR